MQEQFEKLKQEDRDLLLKAPVLVSIIAAHGHHEMNKKKKADAIKLAHLKTFTAVPLLQPYYKEVEKNFEQNFEALEKKYSPFDEGKMQELQQEVCKVNAVLSKMDQVFAGTLHWSLGKYAAHVKKADRGVVESFFMPFLIPGLTE